MADEQPVWVTLAIRATPPADIMHVVETVADPCAVTEFQAIEFDMMLHPVSVRLELPEKSTACDADLSSASMQALAAVV